MALPDPANSPPPPLEIAIKTDNVAGQNGMPTNWQRWFLSIRALVATLGSLTDLAAQTGLGFATRISTAGAWALRTLTQGSNITITNPQGIAGNPVIAVVDA